MATLKMIIAALEKKGRRKMIQIKDIRYGFDTILLFFETNGGAIHFKEHLSKRSKWHELRMEDVYYIIKVLCPTLNMVNGNAHANAKITNIDIVNERLYIYFRDDSVSSSYRTYDDPLFPKQPSCANHIFVKVGNLEIKNIWVNKKKDIIVVELSNDVVSKKIKVKKEKGVKFDIYAAVCAAMAIFRYGSNSALKREIERKVHYVEKR